MLGAVIAFRRDEHMRMTACVAALPPHWRAALDTICSWRGAGVPVAHRLADLSIRALSELPITTSALEITDTWRAAAGVVGIALMIVLAVLRLERSRLAADNAPVARCRCGHVALFWTAAPVFLKLGNSIS